MSTPQGTQWLADDLLEALDRTPGSPERGQIVQLLRTASKIRVTPPLAQAIRNTLKLVPRTVLEGACHLDIGEGSVWMEYPPHPDTLSGGGHDVDVTGVLISRVPGGGRHHVGFVAWRLKGGEIYHSYAILHWGGDTVLDTPSDDALDRMAASVRVSVPERLREEMEIWHAPEDGHLDVESAIRRTRQDALSQSGFAMAAALILSTPDVLLVEQQDGDGDEEDDRITASLPPHGWLQRVRRWLRGGREGLRVGRGGGLRWTPSQEA